MLKSLFSYGVGEGIAKGLNISLILILPLIVNIESYSVIALMIILEQVLFSILLLGQNTTTLRFYSRFERYELTFLKSIRIRVAKISSLFVLFCVIILVFLYWYETNSYYLVAILTISSMPFLLQMELFLTYLRAKNRVAQYLKIRISYQLIKFTFAILFSFNALEEFSYSVSVLISIILICTYIFSKNNKISRSAKSKNSLSNVLLLFGLPLALQATINIAYSVTDRFMLSLLLDKESVSIYSFSYTIATSVLFLANIFVITYLPNIYKKRESLEVSVNLLKKMISRILIVVFIVSLFLYFLIYPVLIEFYALEYREGNGVVALTLFSLAFHIGYLFCLYKLTLLKKISVLPQIALFTLLANALLNYFLIPVYGILGAALATLLSEGVLFAFMYYFSNKFYIMLLNKS